MDALAVASDWDKSELINGQKVMMSPAGTWHNSVGANLAGILHNYLRGKKRCKFFYETMVYLDKDNHFIPDLMIVCDRKKIKANYVLGAPDLVIEILSFSTRKNDLTVKKDAYGRAGVKEYWIVSPKEETVDVYLPHDGTLQLANCYRNYPAEEWAEMSPEERATAELTLKVSLYDDLVIDVREIFED
ncbi:MAG: Uma2 family endonuclease [Selenomonadaceae bacterium]|nr:Uma2 family endonuclease [Selenomonadaceae bacterium]